MTTKPYLQPVTPNLMIIRIEDDGVKKRSGLFHDSEGRLLAYFSDGQISISKDNDESIKINLPKEYIERTKRIVDTGKIEDGDEKFVTDIIKIIGVKLKIINQ